MKCPYCGGKAHIRNANTIYHNNKYKGKIYVCENFPHCDSYVGCHPNTTKPLGRMANKRLRVLKSKAHEVFDPLWLTKSFNKSKSKSFNRSQAYEWLSYQLEIPLADCHMGKFDEDTCRRVIRLCARKSRELDIK